MAGCPLTPLSPVPPASVSPLPGSPLTSKSSSPPLSLSEAGTTESSHRYSVHSTLSSLSRQQPGSTEQVLTLVVGLYFIFGDRTPILIYTIAKMSFEWIGQSIQCLFNLKMSLSFTFVGFLFNAVVLRQFKSVIDVRIIRSPLICDTLFIHYVMFYVSILIWLIVNIQMYLICFTFQSRINIY